MGAKPLLEEGRNCWRIARADRIGIIVDAADYFRVARHAMASARHVIMMIGWDFDMRIDLEPEGATIEGPTTLGDYLTFLTDQTPELQVYVLQWDLGTMEAISRGSMPLVWTEWTTNERQKFRLDGTHPLGAAHHSKIVVIDDAIAFCGGIDMTAERWDTRQHADENPHRLLPSGEPSGPWHDATLAVDGDLARALGDLARMRWEVAIDEKLDPPPPVAAPWPDFLKPTFTGIEAAIARTLPEHDDWDEVREIEAFYLDAIARAQKVLYFESQYFASRAIAEAIMARLAEPEGPEIVLVMPEHADGWLRRKAMDGARKKLLTKVWKADRHGHFAAYYPVTEGGTPIYVHAKVTVVDDMALRIGSSNLNNRSMGFDSECDVIVDAAQNDGQGIEEAIIATRNDLVAEHLGVGPKDVETALAETGSLIATIERLRGEGRSLCRFTPQTVGEDDSPLAENELTDPEEAEGSFFTRFGKALADLAKPDG